MQSNISQIISNVYDKKYFVHTLYKPQLFLDDNSQLNINSLLYFNKSKSVSLYSNKDLFPVVRKVLDNFILGYGFIENASLLIHNFFNNPGSKFNIFGLSAPIDRTNQLVIFDNITILFHKSTLPQSDFYFKFKFYPK